MANVGEPEPPAGGVDDVLAAALRDLQLTEAELLQHAADHVLDGGRVALAKPAPQRRQPGSTRIGRGDRRAGRRDGGLLARLGLRDERDRVALELEQRPATGGVAPPVVFLERGAEGVQVPHERIRHEQPLRPVRGDLHQRQGPAGASQDS